MTTPFTRRDLLCAGLLASGGVAIRLHNALHYPADWGFDAPFNWRYIYRMSRDWALPDPAAGWSTGDPPLYFTLAAALFRGLEALELRDAALLAIPLLGTAAGLAVVALAVLLVRRADPDHPRRALLAGGLLLYLPAHIQMSAMVNEEMLAALFSSLVLVALAGRAEEGPGELRRAAGVGLAAGLALLTKLSGALALATAAGTYALDGLRQRKPRAASSRILVVGVTALLAGGWYYARNRIEYGYVQPFGLPAHQRMFEMPPGERGLGDYLRVPMATWTDPQLLAPDLLRSVWGSTYATLWFDGHRFFLPGSVGRDAEFAVAVRRLGTATLVLALLPSAAWALGVGRGLRRLRRGGVGTDAPLLLLTGLTLTGYVVYTWQNPWFVVLKGTSLLGLSLPLAFYASETLERWTRPGSRAALPVWLLLAALIACSTLCSTFDLVFEKREVSGLQWQPVARPGPSSGGGS